MRGFHEVLKAIFSFYNVYILLCPILDDIVQGMNHRTHSTIKMRPVDVSYENAEELRPSLYDDTPHKRKPRYNVGDLVSWVWQKVSLKVTHVTFRDKLFSRNLKNLSISVLFTTS